MACFLRRRAIGLPGTKGGQDKLGKFGESGPGDTQQKRRRGNDVVALTGVFLAGEKALDRQLQDSGVAGQFAKQVPESKKKLGSCVLGALVR